jgi:FkbM family methyltransferase
MEHQPRNLKTEVYASFRDRNREAERWDEDSVLKSLVVASKPFIVDVGAYTGTSAVRFRNLFPGARLVCFEPNPEAHSELLITKSALGGDFTVFDKAVSDNDGNAAFFVQGVNPGMSGLSTRSLNSRDSIALMNDEPGSREQINTRQVTVETVKLDSVDLLHDQRIDLLKIDVQSMESKVLAGATALLRRTEVVLVEVSFYDMYENRSSFHAIEEFTAPSGLALWAITDHSRNPMNGRSDWVNAVYSRMRI